MVYIKKLEIYGFKSFWFKNVVLNLERGMIAVTGPNGSGKSNIIDAIMFALGENSPKSLRVDKFQSLFHDSQNSSNRLIRVSLTFDNQDRGISVDKDSVVVTREIEGQTSESQYYLNGKKVAKSVITELLEMVVATPNRMNIVQQGMITRISELNSEERRKLIEDIVGLSYFDEKKNEALKQLDESDRRLEIALARIAEIRKRIDELEVERNEQLRFSQLELEIKRFNAVKLSEIISRTRVRLRTQHELLQSKITDSTILSGQLNDLHSEIERIQVEKMKFLQDLDSVNKAKSEVSTSISRIIYDYERKKAIAKESEQRCIQIKEKILPALELEVNSLSQKLAELRSQLDEKQNPILELSEKRLTLKYELDITNSKIDSLSKYSMQASNSITKLEQRYKKLEKIKNNIHFNTSRLQEKIRSDERLSIQNGDKIATMKDDISGYRNQLLDAESVLGKKKRDLKTTRSQVQELEAKYRKLVSETRDLGSLLARASGLATEYESQALALKDMMNEDLSIADITKSGPSSVIKGLVYDLISWEERYEKSVLAAGADFMKAFVVDDVTSMLSILEYAKKTKLMKLRIISLDILKHIQDIGRQNIPTIDENDTNVIGSLDNFVYSEVDGLTEFLFGHTYLVKNVSSAYFLAKQGYRAVSIDGELFEPSGSIISANFGSRIANFSDALLLGDSVNALRKSTLLLKKLIGKRNIIQKEIKADSFTSDHLGNRLEVDISKLDYQKSILLNNLDSVELKLSETIAENYDVISRIKSDRKVSESQYKHLTILSSTMSRITEKLGTFNYDLENELARSNLTRNTILKAMDDSDYELRRLRDSSMSLKNEIEISTNRIDSLKAERADLQLELKEVDSQTSAIDRELASMEEEIKKLRDREQQIIDSSGTSFTILQEYEKKIRMLTGNERKISKEYHSIEKDIAILKKEVENDTIEEKHQIDSLNRIGYDYKEDGSVEVFDTEEIIKQLSGEYEALRPRINLRAHDSYVQVIEGYRGMSARKNHLEKERNSIVLFVEEIDKDKKNIFMEAFNKVDTTLRTTFSEVTGDGGQAWLEIENLGDIFSNGIMLMVQFPGKPARESTGLSGGEKTMAGTIFLLALQSLKPSPFYLLDEVDAHLDSQNTERLSKVLLTRSLGGNQIITVTLKDYTLSKAGLIYGVYTKEGMSQIIRYKHDNLRVLAKANNGTY